MVHRLLLVILLSCGLGQARAQNFQRIYSIPVSNNGSPLVNAWAGGINSGQFSTIDLNYDGREDVLVYDRIGNRISTYINESVQNGVGVFRYTLEYNDAFPSTLKNWVVARDYNCDGKNDLFTNSQSGVVFWKNTGSAADGLSFEAVNNGEMINALYDFGLNPFTSPIYTIGPDMPSFDDYDGDGDIDIFAYTEVGSTVYFFKSMQIEHGNCDVPDYECVNRCYGMYGEGIESFYLNWGNNFQCDFNVDNPRMPEVENASERLHTGSTLLQIDLDQNGIKDLIVGDVSEPNMASLEMEDAVDLQDSVVRVHLNFPYSFGGSDSVHMQLFPAGFYLDVNNNGTKDLLVCPNAIAQAEDQSSVWFYDNTGLNDLPDFQLVQKNFLQDNQLDFGTGAAPSVVDADADGLMDIVVTNKLSYKNGVALPSRAALLRNVGSAQVPAFELADSNWQNLSALNVRSLHLSFGDMDGDGDQDGIAGMEDGYLRLLVNVAGPNQPINFVPSAQNLTEGSGLLIDVGQNSTPQLFDLSGDGVLDLLVGEKNGSVNYFANTGSALEASFTLVEDTLGDALANQSFGINGYSVPFFYKKPNGSTALLLGSETGFLSAYENIDGNLSGTFQLISNAYGNWHEGDRAAVALHDFTGDAMPEMIYGQIAGGLGFYAGIPVGVEETSVDELDVTLYPNPAQDALHVALKTDAQVAVFDLQGRQVLRAFQKVGVAIYDLHELASGIYVVTTTSEKSRSAQRLVIEK
jgi:hypothetical protein